MLKNKSVLYVLKRWKHGKTHWSILQKKTNTTDRALENFDDFYGSVYGNKWKSIRVALLSEHKYVALVNNFGDPDKTITSLESKGAINVRSIYNIEKDKLTTRNVDTILKNKSPAADLKIEQFIQKQQRDEVSSVYPQNVEYNGQLPDSLIGNIDDVTYQCTKEPIVDYKKSLEKTIEEDSEMDFRRMVDTSFGSSGLHEYIPATKLKGMEDWVLESDHYKYYSTVTDFPLNIEIETSLHFPNNLDIYTYEMGNVSNFMKPKKCITGVSSHILMDGASILPPLVLDLKPGERVLDACAAPGGKSLLMLQTMCPEVLVCNDLQESRINRINKMFEEFLFDFEKRWKNKICVFTQEDARNISEYGMYDKILVDVPCTTDRHSVTENDNNIFKSTRIKERLRIPELQAGILSNCIQLLKPGGSLVYSTCSLSPIQNDGVVHMALSNVFRDYSITTTIKNLSLVIKPFSNIFKFENPKSLKYGQLVVPFLPANFGPMYICKITRNL